MTSADKLSEIDTKDCINERQMIFTCHIPQLKLSTYAIFMYVKRLLLQMMRTNKKLNK